MSATLEGSEATQQKQGEGSGASESTPRASGLPGRLTLDEAVNAANESSRAAAEALEDIDKIDATLRTVVARLQSVQQGIVVSQHAQVDLFQRWQRHEERIAKLEKAVHVLSVAVGIRDQPATQTPSRPKPQPQQTPPQTQQQTPPQTQQQTPPQPEAQKNVASPEVPRPSTPPSVRPQPHMSPDAQQARPSPPSRARTPLRPRTAESSPSGGVRARELAQVPLPAASSDPHAYERPRTPLPKSLSETHLAGPPATRPLKLSTKGGKRPLLAADKPASAPAEPASPIPPERRSQQQQPQVPQAMQPQSQPEHQQPRPYDRF